MVLSETQTVLVEWSVKRGPGAYEAFRAFRKDIAPGTAGFRGETLYRAEVDAPTDYDLYVNLGSWDSQDAFYAAVPALRGVPPMEDFEAAPRRRSWLSTASS